MWSKLSAKSKSCGDWSFVAWTKISLALSSKNPVLSFMAALNVCLCKAVRSRMIRHRGNMPGTISLDECRKYVTCKSWPIINDNILRMTQCWKGQFHLLIVTAEVAIDPPSIQNVNQLGSSKQLASITQYS